MFLSVFSEKCCTAQLMHTFLYRSNYGFQRKGKFVSRNFFFATILLHFHEISFQSISHKKCETFAKKKQKFRKKCENFAIKMMRKFCGLIYVLWTDRQKLKN